MSRFVSALMIAVLMTFPKVRAVEVEIKMITPFIDEETVAVVRLDLAKLQIDDMLKRLVHDPDEVQEISNGLTPWISDLQQAGARELYVVVNPADLPGNPFAVVPLVEGADAKKIGSLLCGQESAKPPLAWHTCATVHQAVFAGTVEALERVRRIKPVARPELSEAFEALGNRAIQVAFIPTEGNRRVFEEIQPTLPRELGGGPSTILTKGVIWAALGLETAPNPSAQLVIQSKDEPAAKALEHLAVEAQRWLEGMPWIQSRFPDFAKISSQIKPTVEKDRVVVNVSLDQGGALVETMHQAWQESYGRAKCVNHIKQIELAMHNYHATHNHFPAAYSVDKEGRPLLSWRVAILPFLEQNSLYGEFHLDEPWDSPHNRALVEKMPDVYRCPSIRRKLSRSGKTTYLTPRGKATIFPGPEGMRIKDITDGTSNTISVVDASDDLAVEWTKPQDWEVDPEFNSKGIFGHHPGGTNFGFADGSVHFLKETIKPKTLKLLVTRNGGEVYDPSQD